MKDHEERKSVAIGRTMLLVFNFVTNVVRITSNLVPNARLRPVKSLETNLMVKAGILPYLCMQAETSED